MRLFFELHVLVAAGDDAAAADADATEAVADGSTADEDAEGIAATDEAEEAAAADEVTEDAAAVEEAEEAGPAGELLLLATLPAPGDARLESGPPGKTYAPVRS